MAVSVESSSPVSFNKEALGMMGSSPLMSPSSDRKVWSALRSRVDTLLENRKFERNVGELDRGKGLKEDSLLLLRGFDSIAHTLSQLSSNLDSALQGARDLTKPPTLTEIFSNKLEKKDDKERCESEEEENEEGKENLKRKFDAHESPEEKVEDSLKRKEQSAREQKLKKAKKLAVSMASKAASLTRELKSINSDLCFMQERCAMLEEENRRLREGLNKGIRPEEDDLVRLQLEALLAEKSRLANENANLTRENQCLNQLLEYHQLASQDLSPFHDHAAGGTCLDFSSPLPRTDEEGEDGGKAPTTPRTSNAHGLSSSLDDCF